MVLDILLFSFAWTFFFNSEFWFQYLILRTVCLIETMESVGCSNKRAVNFTKSEEKMLIALVRKFSPIIQNKKTDSGTNQKKREAWQKLTNEFNSAGSDSYLPRSVTILKNKYFNLKKKSQKKLSDWAKSKQYFTSVHQQRLLQESKQKLDHNEKKHQEDLRQKREVHKKKMKMMEEEHEVKMSILKLQKQKLLQEVSE